MQIAPTQDQIQTSLRSFLLAVLPPGTEVIIAKQNRVPEPSVPNFAIISAPRWERSDTNIDTYADVAFTASLAPQTASFEGSIAPAPAVPNAMPSGVLTVTAVDSGEIVVGEAVSGSGISSGTVVTGQLSGTPGGIGTYSVQPSQTAPATSIAGTWSLLDVTAVQFGTIGVGALLFGVNVAAATVINQQLSGTSGGIGTYAASPSQTIGSEKMAAGVKILQQNAKCICQIDFHSGDNSSSDMAQIVSTVFRDESGVDLFAAQDPNYGVVPLYADDPREVPFVNAEQAYEWRYVVDARMQVNQVVSIPQQFADSLVLNIIDLSTF